MTTAIYERQQSLNLVRLTSVAVVGAGGTGTPVATLIAMTGVDTLYLFDDDNLELSNLNRLPYTLTHIGRPKVEILKEYLNTIRPEMFVMLCPKAGEYTLGLCSDAQHLFDCTDSQATQTMINNWCKEHGVPYTRVGYDGLHITVSESVPQWATEQARGGYRNTPSWVAPPALAATLAVLGAFLSMPIEANLDIRDLPRILKEAQ